MIGTLIGLFVGLSVSHANASSSGAYLAYRSSSALNDFQKAAEFSLTLIRKGINGPKIYNDTLLFLVAAGDLKNAYIVASEMLDLNLVSPAVSLTLIIEKAKAGEIEKALRLLERFDGQLPQLFSLSIKGWLLAKLGESKATFDQFQLIKKLG